MERFVCVVALAGTVFVSDLALAQTFTRDNYFDYIAPMPRLVEQSPESVQFHLYGDRTQPDYRDDNLDGVDDLRAERLLALAELFAPILHRNNHSVPRDFEAMLRLRFDANPLRNADDFRRFYDAEPVLSVDVWDETQPAGARLRSEDVNLAAAERHAQSCVADNECGDTAAHFHDTTLKRLLEASLETEKTDSSLPRRTDTRTLFFDFPGADEITWRRIYRALEERDRSEFGRWDTRVYVHPFVVDSPDAKGERRYEFVLQYWLFYPYNDGANNHEGDWEHVNARVTTTQARGDPLTDAEVGQILDADALDILPSLVIRKVDYYFHHYVMVVDYTVPGVDFSQPDRRAFLRNLESIEHRRTLQRWVYERVHERIHLFPGTVNTHPIGYIGGDNVGLDQILTLPGGKNRNSHGTYPFPGIWRVGPIGTAERVTGDFEYRFPAPALAKTPTSDVAQRVRRHRREADDYWIAFDKSDLFLIPDWECVSDLVLSDPKARRRWSWLILPIRWGFPASDSPIGGRLRFTDLGHNAPVGPAYHASWNRVGAAPDAELYDPHVSTAASKVGLSDNFRASWGCMNLTIPTLISLPAANVFWTLTGARFEKTVKLFPKTEAPFRYYSVAVGPVVDARPNEVFAELLPREENAVIESHLLRTGGRVDASSLRDEASPRFEPTRSFALMFNQHIGTLTSENALTRLSRRVSYRFDDDAGGSVSGDLTLWELQGSIRWNLLDGAFQPFVRAGYGWSWYRTTNALLTSDGDEAVVLDDSRWFHTPTLRDPLPNTLHGGFGVEWSLLRDNRFWEVPLRGLYFFDPLIGMPDFGVRLDFTYYRHRLGKPNAHGDDPVVRRRTVGLSGVVGF